MRLRGTPPTSWSGEQVIGGSTGVVGLVTVTVIVTTRGWVGGDSLHAFGLLTVWTGMGLAAWAGAHLGRGVLGLVEPRLDRVVTRGPYRMVRHPLYLGITTAMLGASVAAGSVAGLLVTLVLFVPIEVRRARLEERALRARFPGAWSAYAARVPFLLPRWTRQH